MKCPISGGRRSPLAFWLTRTPEFGGRFLVNFAVLLALTLVVASLSWRFVEQPALRLKPLRFGGRGRHVAT